MEDLLPVTFELFQRSASPHLSEIVSGIVGYRENVAGRIEHYEAASLVVPVIISLGSPFEIALGRKPTRGDRQSSFAAGLYAGPVHICSDGDAECVQINFTPLGAFRVFGPVASDLAERMVDVGDIFGASGRRLREQLGATNDWQRRFDLIEDFFTQRVCHRPSAEISFAYRSLAATGGNINITSLARTIGRSRKHLATQFRAEIGLGPKVVARMMRFHQACQLARSGTPGGWAAIAADCGYADQAHLTREFVALADEPPGAWARRVAVSPILEAWP